MAKAQQPVINQKTEQHSILEPVIKSLWADNFSMAIREDGIVMVRAFSNLPEGNIEQARIVTSKGNIEAFIDSMCKIMKYFPKDPKEKTQKS